MERESLAYDFERGPTAHIHQQIMQEAERARLQAFACIAQNLLDLKNNQQINVAGRNGIIFNNASTNNSLDNSFDLDAMIGMFIQELAVDTQIKFQNTLRFLAMLKGSPDAEYILYMKYIFQDRSL